MVRPGRGVEAVARMVELQAVQPGYPLYGQVMLPGGRPFTHDLVRGGGVLVRPELLMQLGRSLGDGIVIGNRTFTIRGMIAGEPGRRRACSAWGRACLVDDADLRAPASCSSAAAPAARSCWRFPRPDIEPLVGRLREALKDSSSACVRSGGLKIGSVRTSPVPRTT